MPIRAAGNATPVRGGRSGTPLKPRHLAGVVVLVIAVILLIVVLIVAALN